MRRVFIYSLASLAVILISFSTLPQAQTQTTPEEPVGNIQANEMPAGTLDGLSQGQKVGVMRVLNLKNCTCGCSWGSIARCSLGHRTCETAPGLIAQTIEMVKSGKSFDEIGKAIDATRKGPPPSQPAPPSTASYIAIRPDDPVRGPKLAKVTIVVFSDFQCPFCGRVEPTLKQIMDIYKKDVRFVWKHQPLPFHPNAMPAAEAAEAAREQGKFWEMHDLMFADQAELSPAKYEAWAAQLGLNMDRFRKSIADHRNQARIKEDMALGTSNGATGTPTFFINGQLLVGALPLENFKAAIDGEIKKADVLLKTHKLNADFYKVAAQENAKNARPLPQPGAQQAKVVNVPLRSDDPIAGPKVARVTIVEFSDFQCPFCGRVEPTLKQIQSTYGDSVRIVWKHQPLPFHPNAMPAAETAEAAREQGKFWEMHDLMYANQSLLSPQKYEEWAAQIGLNVDTFKKSVSSHSAQARIQEDMKQGQAIGADGTPTFFINGRQVIGALPFGAFKAVIDEELVKADALIKSGHPLDEKFYQTIVDNNVKQAAGGM